MLGISLWPFVYVHELHSWIVFVSYSVTSWFETTLVPLNMDPCTFRLSSQPCSASEVIIPFHTILTDK
jgi:hypothetical protein